MVSRFGRDYHAFIGSSIVVNISHAIEFWSGLACFYLPNSDWFLHLVNHYCLRSATCCKMDVVGCFNHRSTWWLVIGSSVIVITVGVNFCEAAMTVTFNFTKSRTKSGLTGCHMIGHTPRCGKYSLQGISSQGTSATLVTRAVRTTGITITTFAFHNYPRGD